jgi:hypothetical protein
MDDGMGTHGQNQDDRPGRDRRITHMVTRRKRARYETQQTRNRNPDTHPVSSNPPKQTKKRVHSLEDIRVELIPCTHILHPHQHRAQRKRTHRIDKAPAKTNRRNKCAAKPSDDHRLPTPIKHPLAHKLVQCLGRLGHAELIVDDAPVDAVRVEELTEVERGGLFEEFCVGCVRGAVAEGEEHDGGEVHAGYLDVEHARSGLDLGLQPVRRCAEPSSNKSIPYFHLVHRSDSHHQRPRKLQNKLVPLQNLRNMHRNLPQPQSIHRAYTPKTALT